MTQAAHLEELVLAGCLMVAMGRTTGAMSSGTRHVALLFIVFNDLFGSDFDIF